MLVSCRIPSYLWSMESVYLSKVLLKRASPELSITWWLWRQQGRVCERERSWANLFWVHLGWAVTKSHSMPRRCLAVLMSNQSQKCPGTSSSHKRAKRNILSRDWCSLMWEQCVPEACSETHLGPSSVKHWQRMIIQSAAHQLHYSEKSVIFILSTELSLSCSSSQWNWAWFWEKSRWTGRHKLGREKHIWTSVVKWGVVITLSYHSNGVIRESLWSSGVKEGIRQLYPPAVPPLQ